MENKKNVPKHQPDIHIRRLGLSHQLGLHIKDVDSSNWVSCKQCSAPCLYLATLVCNYNKQGLCWFISLLGILFIRQHTEVGILQSS
jgi:hypothetical protein